MKRDLFNRDYFGNSCPRIKVNGMTFEVHELPFGKGYEIVHIDTWVYSKALIYDEDRVLPFEKTPCFESRIHAVRFMLENAELLH